MTTIAIESQGEVDRANHTGLMADALAARYLSRVHRFAVMVSPRGVDPEDLAQQAMLKALAAADRFDPNRGSMDAWLWRIVVNVARDEGRSARRREFLFERLALRHRVGSVAMSADTLALDRLRDRDLIAAVRRLPRHYRSLIALRYGAGLRLAEVAEVIGTSRMAVEKATRRALDKLRADLGGNGES